MSELALLSDDETLIAAAALPGHADLQKKAEAIRRRRAAEAAMPDRPPHIARALSDVKAALGRCHVLTESVGIQRAACPYCGKKGPVNRRKTAAQRRGGYHWRDEVHDLITVCELGHKEMCFDCFRAVLPLAIEYCQGRDDIEIRLPLKQVATPVLVRQWRRCPSCGADAHEGMILRYGPNPGRCLEGNSHSGRCPRCGWERGDREPMLGGKQWTMLPHFAIFTPRLDLRRSGEDMGAVEAILGDHLRNVEATS